MYIHTVSLYSQDHTYFYVNTQFHDSYDVHIISSTSAVYRTAYHTHNILFCNLPVMQVVANNNCFHTNTGCVQLKTKLHARCNK